MDETSRRALLSGGPDAADGGLRERVEERPAARRRVPAEALHALLHRDLLPRLGLLHAEDLGDAPSLPPPRFREVETFTLCLLREGIDAALGLFEALMRRGYATEDLLDGLLAPAARLMGLYWEADDCDFLTVDIGVSRLQRLVRIVRPVGDPADARPGHEAILSVTPGECHRFGPWLVGEHLSAAGWHVLWPEEPSLDALVARAVEAPNAVIGLSLSCDRGLDELALAIRAVRRATPGHSRMVMVGGRIFHDDPERVVRVGADGTADDAPSAVRLAERLLVHQRR